MLMPVTCIIYIFMFMIQYFLSFAPCFSCSDHEFYFFSPILQMECTQGTSDMDFLKFGLRSNGRNLRNRTQKETPDLCLEELRGKCKLFQWYSWVLFYFLPFLTLLHSLFTSLISTPVYSDSFGGFF